MLGAALIGGAVNYLLQENQGVETKTFKYPLWQCIILGLGATLMVPLFLFMAESKLIEDVTLEKPKCTKDSCKTNVCVMDSCLSDSIHISCSSQELADMVTKLVKQVDSASIKLNETNKKAQSKDEPNRARDYLLFAAYCILAASAGYQFINKLIDSAINKQQLKSLQVEREVAQTELNKRIKNGQMSQNQEINKLQASLALTRNIPFVLPALPPVTIANDPQKNRFGGKSINMERALKAEVVPAGIPDFFEVTLRVESTKPDTNPLSGEVVFFIPDTFSPSVFTATVDSATGKALSHKIFSCGAFTVGVVADNGKTMLELDLGMENGVAREFKGR